MDLTVHELWLIYQAIEIRIERITELNKVCFMKDAEDVIKEYRRLLHRIEKIIAQKDEDRNLLA